ncbi:hypothetical protein ATO13_16499 [Stappia sp. 22II-S9-Z10]|nr:hypothetical protein ATO13_16499 [Stappia sp. 22II-S9-Z10]
MSLLRTVLAELVGMFVADAAMAVAILALVAVAGALAALTAPPHIAAMAVLTAGALAVPVVFAVAYARRTRRARRLR